MLVAKSKRAALQRRLHLWYFPRECWPESMRRGVLAVPLIHDNEIWEKRLATLPVASYGAGETVFTEGTKTGRLLILKAGLVSVIKGGIEIAQVAEPGVIFGELSALLDQPHTADVRTVEASQFHVADARARPGRAAVYRDGSCAAPR